jgi:hypothetical protein
LESHIFLNQASSTVSFSVTAPIPLPLPLPSLVAVPLVWNSGGHPAGLRVDGRLAPGWHQPTRSTTNVVRPLSTADSARASSSPASLAAAYATASPDLSWSSKLVSRVVCHSVAVRLA